MAENSAERTIADVGKRLSQSRLSKDTLVKLLKQASSTLLEFTQSPSLQSTVEPISNSIAHHNLLQHKDKDVRLLVAACFSEIIRILAPDPPFSDELLKEIFRLFISIFGELDDTKSPYFPRRVKILETVARVRCCVLMLDIGCNDLVVEMFEIFFSIVRDEHPQSLSQSLLSIMTLILEEEVSQPLLDVILRNLLKKEKSVTPASYRLATSVLQNCMEKLEPFVRRFLAASISEKGASGSELGEFYHEIIFEIFQCAPQMLLAVIPNLTEELLTDQVDVRINSVQLVGRLFAIHGRQAAQEYHQLFFEFIKRFSDKSVDVRLCAVECAKGCYIANPSGAEANKILGALEARLLDFDDKVRIQTVSVICDLAKCHPRYIPSELVLNAAERLRDKKISVRKNAMQKLLELYRCYSQKCSEEVIPLDDQFEQIPGKILKLCFDKDCKEFRPQSMELVFVEDLFPATLPVKDRLRHWAAFFSHFTPPHKKALESILTQKWRLQMAMQDYLSLRSKRKENGSEEVERSILASFRKASASFPDPLEAEKQFQMLHQMKDNNVFKALQSLLDEGKGLDASHDVREDLLKRIGNKHPQYEFLRILSCKCSFSLFSPEHIRALLLQCLSCKSGADEASLYTHSDLLLMVVSSTPVILRGCEKDLTNLLLEDVVPLRFLQIIAKAGTYISTAFSSLLPVLKHFCLEGTRLQAKHSASAIVALAPDSSEQLADFYTQLVTCLMEEKNVPSILQSLGIIGQRFQSLYETQEEEITQHILQKIFGLHSCLNLTEEDGNLPCSSNCKLKVYALKALVKSSLAHGGNRSIQRLKRLTSLLQRLMYEGEVSDGIISSENDKAHIRLAAAVSSLRLSSKWDSQILPRLFCLIIRTAQDSSTWVQRGFVDKLKKLLRLRLVPSKYACAFALAVSNCNGDFREDCRKCLIDFVKDYRLEAQKRQSSTSQNHDGLIMIYYPEYVLSYLVFVLAHDANFPDTSCEETDFASACSPLFFFLQVMIDPDSLEGKKGTACNVSYIISIFRAIKMSEDAVDGKVNTKLYIIADIGLLITRWLSKRSQLPDASPGPVYLPSMFYKKDAAKGGHLQSDLSHLPDCITEESFIERFSENSLLQPTVIPVKSGRKQSEDAVLDNANNITKNVLQSETDNDPQVSTFEGDKDSSRETAKDNPKGVRRRSSARSRSNPSSIARSHQSSAENNVSSCNGALKHSVPDSEDKLISSRGSFISKSSVSGSCNPEKQSMDIDNSSSQE